MERYVGLMRLDLGGCEAVFFCACIVGGEWVENAVNTGVVACFEGLVGGWLGWE